MFVVKCRLKDSGKASMLVLLWAFGLCFSLCICKVKYWKIDTYFEIILKDVR